MYWEVFGYQVPDWQIYVTLGVLFMCAEVFTAGFVLLPIGIAFILTAAFTTFVFNLPLQLVLLAINSLVVFFLFRKFVTPRFTLSHMKTNVDSMIGKEAIVIEPISADGSRGYVKLYGDEWRALPMEPTPIEKGTRVTIEKLEGNKVYVRTRN